MRKIIVLCLAVCRVWGKVHHLNIGFSQSRSQPRQILIKHDDPRAIAALSKICLANCCRFFSFMGFPHLRHLPDFAARDIQGRQQPPCPQPVSMHFKWPKSRI